MEQDLDLKERLDEFCGDFNIPDAHFGSLRLLSGMAYVLGLELEVRITPRKEQANDRR
jgi:hypothetical protein